ncbi:FG-GAP-like repeat-containing protein [Lysobacter sp. KIS68-7]|uniref:FG-GAP-like repeat-containing protein n=1 Tax=Lysobacter sp. KIS68-7 TaxID=2904252 RepID=UPI001E60099D|nr:FG-GAP-like repeat-containing protein [Lysobacter sp. KIS68-7]UHQ18763.1 FG-GAP-like repeat-containing protein [Lysobacter sp. KIS68-7]
MESKEQGASRLAVFGRAFCASMFAGALALSSSLVVPAQAAPLNFRLIAGGVTGDGGQAANASFIGLGDLVLDPAGNLYVSEFAGNRIRKIAPDGTITTIVGGAGVGFSGDGGPASAARISGPMGLVRDASGNLYFSDSRNHRVRRIDGAGTITTIAGGGEQVSGTGPATSAKLYEPSGLAFDAAGDLYFADASDYRVRKIAMESGTISVFAGDGGIGYVGDGGPATSARFNRPLGIDFDAAGNLYVADLVNSAVRKIATDGTISTIMTWDFMQPSNVAVGPDGAVYTDDYNSCLVMKWKDGVTTTVTGDGTCEEKGDGGMASLASSGSVDGMVFDASGALYLADADFSRIRRISADGFISTFAGRKRTFTDGTPALDVPLTWGLGVATSATGNVAIADSMWERRVVEVSASGTAKLRAGNGTLSTSCSLPCAAKDFSLYQPWGVAYAPNGTLHVGDRVLNQVYAVDANGTMRVVAGYRGSVGGGEGAPATSVKIDPYGIAFDPSGNLFIADYLNNRIRKVDAAGAMTTVATSYHPMSLTTDVAGNVYYYEKDSLIIYKLAPNGSVTHVVGNGGLSQDESEGQNAVNTYIPDGYGLAVHHGEVFFSVSGRVRKLGRDGLVHTVEGFSDYARGLAIGWNALIVNGQNGRVTRAALSRPVHDFEGDGRGDLFWRNGTTGANALWKGGSAATQQAVTSVTDKAWKLVGSGDFDGDSRTDLFWRNTNTGANAIWRGAISTQQISTVGVTDQAWKVVAVGDFDGDGRSDLFWRNTTTGANTIWRSASNATQTTTTGVTNLSWQVVGAGDFDGDGRDDVLWRNAADGSGTIWKSGNGATQQGITRITDMRWKTVGIGDFDADGRADIAWRNSVTGANTIWKAGNSATLQTVVGVTQAGWQIQRVGDFDGDGRADLFWRNTTNGANTIWRAANNLTQTAVSGVTDLAWTVLPTESQP